MRQQPHRLRSPVKLTERTAISLAQPREEPDDIAPEDAAERLGMTQQPIVRPVERAHLNASKADGGCRLS